MTKIFNIILRTIFWLSIAFLVVTFFALTFGTSSSYEFADSKLSHQFYNLIGQGLPIAILLTLTGTIKRTKKKSKNISVIIVTILGSIYSIFIVINMLFSVGFLTITNDKILFKNRTNPTTMIVAQTIGQGALGADGHRIVKLEPLLKFWNKSTFVDTAMMNRTEWIFVNEDLHLTKNIDNFQKTK